MSSFRRYGGLNFSANNNITRSYISNSEQLNINNYSGQQNSKEIFASHIDMSGNSILHTGTIYFQNGTSMSTAGNVGAQGAQGAQGVNGYQGFNGVTGAQGTQGDYGGPTGAQGDQGPQGAQGDQGPQGAQGATGSGAQGDQGPQGAQGDQGPQGAQGATGSGAQGDQGPQGAQGATGSGAQGATGSGVSYWTQSGTDIYYTLGNVGIGVTGPTSALDVVGDIKSSLTITAGSDYRIKEYIKSLNLDEYNVDNLRPVYFKFKDSGKESIGVIAHELQEYYPFLVEGEKDGEKTQTVNYNGLIGVLIKEIQDLKKRVYILENKIE